MIAGKNAGYSGSETAFHCQFRLKTQSGQPTLRPHLLPSYSA